MCLWKRLFTISAISCSLTLTTQVTEGLQTWHWKCSLKGTIYHHSQNSSFRTGVNDWMIHFPIPQTATPISQVRDQSSGVFPPSCREYPDLTGQRDTCKVMGKYNVRFQSPEYNLQWFAKKLLKCSLHEPWLCACYACCGLFRDSLFPQSYVSVRSILYLFFNVWMAEVFDTEGEIDISDTVEWYRQDDLTFIPEAFEIWHDRGDPAAL